MPFKYTFPSLESFAQTCDTRTVGKSYNESTLGIYCCRPCKLYRLVNERCGSIHSTTAGHDQSCFLENTTTQAGLPILRTQSSLDNTEANPHWLFIPPTPNRGIEDARTNASMFKQAWRLAMDPLSYTSPIIKYSSGKGDKRQHFTAKSFIFDDKQDEMQRHYFNTSIIPGKMGLTNVAIGINQANHRSQHHAHIHYAAFPISFRKHLLDQANVPPSASSGHPTCTVASGLKYGEKNVTYYAWFFPWDLATTAAGEESGGGSREEKVEGTERGGGGGGGMWTLRDLALRQCPPLLDTLVKDMEGNTIVRPPTLPFSPPTSNPFQGDEDFLMSQIAAIIAPSFSLDSSTQRPSGHYVLMGSTSSNFHAESLLCTQYGTDDDSTGAGDQRGGGGEGKGGWDPVTDCPATAEGWPKPEKGGKEGGEGEKTVVKVTVKGKAILDKGGGEM
ncbi:cdp-diacylglycerol pyrophosphatase [Nannochloropsis oceanica]